MGFARRAGVPVLLLGDIERGGVIASLVGTQAVLDPADAAMIAGFAVNKFRGAPSLFDAGIADIERRTGWPCYGVIPWLPACARLPAEDAVSSAAPAATVERPLRIVAPMLSRMANFDDADPLRHEPAVDFRFIPPGQPLPRDADLVILFGCKSTIAELCAFLRAEGWDHDLAAHVRAGGRVLGLCGGYQMLGRRIEDPDGIDGPPAAAEGLNLLDVTTRMRRSKAVRRVSGRCAFTQAPVRGYEIHAGETEGPGRARPLLHIDGHGEGARSPDGRIEGSYVHGLFASDEYRAGYLSRMGAASSALCYDECVQTALDELADGLESALEIERLFAAAGRTAVL